MTSDETRGIETVPAKAAEPAGRTRVERIAPRDAIRDLTSSRVGFVARLGVAQDMAPALEDTGLDADEVGVGGDVRTGRCASSCGVGAFAIILLVL